MNKELTEYNANERKRIILDVIEMYREGKYSLAQCMKRVGVSSSTFYVYMQREDELRQAYNEAKRFTAAAHDDEMKVLARERIRRRMAGEDTKKTKQITIYGEIDKNEVSETIDASDADAFERIMSLIAKIKTPVITVTAREEVINPSDALLVAAKREYDADAD